MTIIWQCVGCAHILKGNPQFCPNCRYTVCRPIDTEPKENHSCTETFEDELPDHIIESMADPKYAALVVAERDAALAEVEKFSTLADLYLAKSNTAHAAGYAEGVAKVKAAVEALAGYIWCESQVGRTIIRDAGIMQDIVNRLRKVLAAVEDAS